MRMARLLAFLLVAAPACASEVVVHLALSDSMRAGLERGAVQALRVEIAAPHREAHIVETKEPVAIVSDVDAGTWRLRAFVVMRDAMYIVHPRGEEIAVAADTRADVIVQVPPLLVSGTMTLRGTPFAGRMLVSPSVRDRAAWSVNVPIDEKGRFAFPVPWPGDWDLQLYARGADMSAKVPRVAFRTTRVDVTLPEGAIHGRVVDGSGHGVAGVRVLATLNDDVAGGTVSGNDGRFTLDALLGGTWTLTVPGQKPVKVELPEGGRKEVVLLR